MTKSIIKAIAIYFLAYSTYTHAEDDYTPIKPLNVKQDVNSVNLLSGKYYPTLPSLSVPAAPRLSFETLQKFNSKITGTLYKSTTWNNIGSSERTEIYSLTYGGVTSEQFNCKSYDCESTDNYGSSLFGNINTKNSRLEYRQGGTGIRVEYDSNSSFFSWNDPYNNKAKEGTWYVTRVFYPDGETITFDYDKVFDPNISPFITFHRPISVESNLGYKLKLTYLSDDLTTGASGWSKVSTATIVKTNSPSEALAKFTYTSNTITDLLGRTWNYSGFSNALGSSDTSRNFSLRLPSDSSNTISVTSNNKNHGAATHNYFVTNVTKNGVAYNYTYIAASGTGKDPNKQFTKVTITGPDSYSRVIDLDVLGGSNKRSFITKDTNAYGQSTLYKYLGGRLKEITFPEGNKELYEFDAHGNVTKKTNIAKSGSGIANIVTTANYDIYNCTKVECFKPTSITDAKGNTTDYTFASHGGMLTKLEPADKNNNRRLTTNTWQEINGFTRLKSTNVCTQSSCSSTDRQVTNYTYWGNTNLPKTVTKTNGVGVLKQVTTYTYDNAGRVAIEDGPLAGTDDAIYYRYDNAGRKIWEIGAKNQRGYRVAQRFTYRNEDDQFRIIETGTLTSPTSTSLSVYNTETIAYNTRNLATKKEISSPSKKEAVIQFTYDTRNRLMCTATRMNASTFNSLPSSACSLASEGVDGPDRITRNYYDRLSRSTKVTSGYNTPDAGNDIEIAYTANGEIYTRKDGEGNVTSYTYDGFDRLKRTTFEDNTYEQNSYDANSNLKTWRKRDGKILTHYYDAINKKTQTTVPGESTLYFNHDGLGRNTSVIRSLSKVSFTYDELSRLKTTTTNNRTLAYTYDIGDRKTRLTHPDGFYVTYAFDATGALTSIKENGSNLLANYTYNSKGQLTSIFRGNDTSSSVGYDTKGRVTAFNHSGINNTSFGYNYANQLKSKTVSNNNYQIQIPTVDEQNYYTNDLNQYTSVGGKSLTYDTNGNLKTYDGWGYTYNAHNRLKSAVKLGSSLALGYDAIGRLNYTTLNRVKTTFLYDANELVAEYNSSGSLLRRYVHGIGEDDPLVWYEGSGTGNKRYLHADERGSIISETNGSGSIVATHKYGPFGEPINTSSSRFRYTGQILIPGTELYYYKARIYHPKLGRFLQTDPVGYEDQMNLYAYVGNDPVNYTDPTGETRRRNQMRGAAIGYAVASAAEAYFDKGTPAHSYAVKMKGIYSNIMSGKTGKIHNNTKGNQPAEQYALKDRDTGDVKKYGETTHGEDKFGKGKQQRYSKKELKANNVDYVKEASGTKKEMHKLQTDKIRQHTQEHGKRPPLNKTDY